MVAIYGLILVSTGLGFELLDRNTQLKYIKHFHSVSAVDLILTSILARCFPATPCDMHLTSCSQCPLS